MIKRIGKRALSVFLTLVLIATTFFIFDPSVLKIDSEAYVNTEATVAAKSVSSQEAYAPETIYLKPGSATFNYFCNYNSKTGAPTEPKSTSSYLYFKNFDATEVTLAVNRVYYKNGSTDTNHTGTLKVNNTTVSTYAGCSATSTNFVNSATAVATGTNTINYTVSTGSLSGCAQNTTYFIEWVVRYKIDKTYHLMFMYTGVYCPSLSQAGLSYATTYNATSSNPKQHAYSFITGAHKYGGGNRVSKYTSTTVSTTAKTAPLISFVGQNTSSANYTFPGGSSQWNSTDNFAAQANGGVFVAPGNLDGGSDRYHKTTWTKTGSYNDPNPTGSTTGNADSSYTESVTTGVAYIVVDTSRYTNYNQIPYLSTGWVEFYHHWDGSGNQINSITGKDQNYGNLEDPVSCSVDTGSFTDGDSTSFARGLYPINGSVRSGFIVLDFDTKNGYESWVSTQSLYVHTYVGLHTTTVSKENLRLTYNKALHSNIDLVNVNASKSALSSMNYATYYSQLKTTGEALCDPTLYSMSANSTLDGYVTTWNKAIINALDTSSVYFYVPEVIYLNPVANSSSQYPFQYYVDRESDETGKLTANGADTSGNVYFKCASASRVVSITGSIDGGNVTLNYSDNSANIKKATMSGYSTTYADKMITWTCKYIDKVSGKEMTATAYTRCVAMPKATSGSTVISASAQAGYNSSWHDDTNIAVTGWIVGATSVEARSYTITSQSAGNVNNGSVGAGRGGYKNNYLEATSTVPTNGNDNVSDLYNESYNGGSGHWEKDDNVNWTTGGKGTIYIDSSRYTNLGQIPQLYVGIDVNNKYVEKGHNKSADIALYYDWYSNGSNKNPTTYTAASQTGVSTGNAQRGKKLTSATFSLKTTTTNTLVLHAWSKSYGDSKRTAQATCYLVCQFRDKTILREAYMLMMKNSTFLQQAYFTTNAWNNFTTYRNYIYNYLLNPNSTASQATLDSYGKNLYDQVAKMVACVKAEVGSETATYTTYGSSSSTSVTRSAVLKTGTVKVYHRYINGGSGSSTTTAPLNCAVDGTNVEEKTYYYGETVNTGYNDTKGYSYFGYFRHESETEEGRVQWTSPSNGNLVGNAPGPNKYGSSGHNQDILVAVPNLTYTYVYHKDKVSVCKDYGESPQAFGTVRNLANLSDENINGTYTGSANITNVSKTGFNFELKTVITDSSTGAQYNEIAINNAATGLTAGGTYTLSFKSNREYDDMAWYGNKFNAANGWVQNEDFLYTPGYLAVYVLSTTEGKKALQKVDTRFSEGGTVGSFTLASGVTSVSLIIRNYSDGTLYPGQISDFKIAEGRYVHEGFAGNSISLGSPTWIGHTFKGWAEADSPFDGTLSGTLNTTYKYGLDDDIVQANWKINSYDVMFDNEFDFDSWNFSGANGGTLTFDKETNSLTLTSTSADSYTMPYEKSGSSYLTLKEGHTYRFKYHYKQESGSVAGTLRPFVFAFADTSLATSQTIKSQEAPSITATAEGDSEMTFTVPTGKKYVTFRLGVKTSGMKITFSDIYIQDITNAIGVADSSTDALNNLQPKIGTDVVHGANVVYDTTLGSSDSLNGTMPTETRSNYTFAGWYDSRDSYGSGTGTKYTENTVIGASNVKLYSKWTVGVTYNINGGRYRDYYQNNNGQVKNRSGLAIGTSVAVSNNIAQGSTNWNSTSLSYACVPFKIGYNFKGWLASSADSSVNGKTYWPGQTITVKCSVTLTAQWTAAPTTSLGQQEEVGTSNNGYTFYPGQLYFYKFTPSRNMYASGYTYNSGSADPGVNLYTGTTFTQNNDNYAYSYGLSDITSNTKNALTSYGMASGTTYYYAVFPSSATTSLTTKMNFKLVEHTVSYTLDANGGSVSPTAKTGNYNTETPLPTPTKTGHTFSGWLASDTGANYREGKVPAADNKSRIEGNTASLVKKVKLTAQWNVNQYAVNVYAQYNKASSATAKTTTYERDTDGVGGTVKVGSSTAGASATANVNYQGTTTIVAAAKTGYSFDGWYASPTLSSDNKTVTAWGTPFSSSASVTVKVEEAKAYKYYAKFEINTCPIGVYAYYNTAANPGTFTNGDVGGTVGFTSSVGSKGTTRTNVYGQSVTIYAKPKTGYTFEGWYLGNTSAMSGQAPITSSACTLSGVVYSYTWITKDTRSYSAKFAIKKYTLTVDPNNGKYGGSTSKTLVEQYYGTTYTLSTPERLGYTFKSWTLTLTEGGTAKGSITNNVYTFGAGHDTATANWAINNYKITINPNGGSCSNVQYYKGDGSKEEGTLTQSGSFTASTGFDMAYGSTASITPPRRTGYTFTGWTKTAGSGTLTNGSPVTSANATFKVTNATATLTAGWQINKYKLTVNAYSNTAAATTTFANNDVGGTVKIEALTATDINSDGSSTATATDITGNGTKAATANVYYNHSAKITATAKPGYRFIGWQTNVPTSSNSVSSTSNPLTTAAMGTSGLTYYARFEIYSYTVSVSAAYSSASAPDTYTVGITGGTVKIEGEYLSNSTDDGKGTVTAKTPFNTSVKITPTANPGYEFVGWFSSTTATKETSLANPYTPTVTGNITLVGKFKIKSYPVTVKAYGNSANGKDTFTEGVGGTVSGGGKVYYNLTATLKATPADGYAFAGWYTSTNFTGNPVSKDKEYKPVITQGITYYAKFTVKESSITVYAYGNSADETGTYKQGVGGVVNIDGTASGTSATNTFYYGKQYTIRAYPSTGYAFSGWYTDTTFTTEATEDAYELGGLYQDYYYRRYNKQDKNETVYAKFDIQGYTLTVNAKSNTGGALNTYQNNTTGGTVKINNNYATNISGNGTKTATAKIYFGKSASITATPATGYKFAGWYTTSDLSGTAASPSATFTTASMTTSGLTYYAKFSVGSITITYNANGGTSGTVTSGTAYYNTAYTIPATANPTKTGCSFAGWSTTETASSAEYTLDKPIPAATISGWYPNNVTLYAVWEKVSFAANIAAAYDTYVAQGTYKIGTTGGTATLRETEILNGEKIATYITYEPATGYKFSQWRYIFTENNLPSQGQTVSPNWGTLGTDETQMQAGKVNIIVYFSISEFDVNAYAYSNSASSTGKYTNNAAGGTVKFGTTGAAGATARATAVYTANVTMNATVATGYRFDGWFTDSALTKSAGTAASLTATVGDNVKDTSLNKYYAKFSILSYTAYGSARYYRYGVDSATGAGLIGTKGGTVKLSNDNSTWVTAQGSNKASVTAYYTATVYYSATPGTGYEFIGWYSGDDADIFAAAVLATTLNYSTTMPAGNIDIHAKFTPYNFTLTLHPNGGVSGTTVSITLTYNDDTKIPSNGIPTKIGYNFLGWSDTEGGAVNTVYNGLIPYTTVNSWFSTTALENTNKIIYAVWEEAIYTVTLDHQNGTASSTITVTVGSAMPAITAPTYSGYVFGGYYLNTGGEGTQYYTADAKSAQNWDIKTNTTLYAKWTCPVLSDVTYNNGTWIYEYVDASGNGTMTVTSSEMFATPDDITKNAPENVKEITSVAAAETDYTDTSKTADTQKAKMKVRLEGINLNHYTQKSLSELLNCVNATNTAQKLSKLSQPEANLELAKMAYNIELAISGNKKDEKKAPSIRIYETSSKLTNIKSDTITKAEDSANGSTYTYPSTTQATSYTYAGKYSYTKGSAVNYYLYTNSATPVVALELDDGAVGTTVANNTSSYPTKVPNITSNAADYSYVKNTDTYMESAVKATDDITTAWFYPYTQAGIGTEHDYNAKTVIYLTPTFSSSGTKNEIVYTITPSDDAYTVNEGVASAELAEATTALKTNYSSYNYSVTEQEQITICICYHNSMNGTSDNGGNVGDPYLQLYPDQVNADTWINQMHLFRQSGGASNWELPLTSENIYPVADKDYASTGYVLGSFLYVFDSTNEPTATSYAEAGDLDGAKNAIISSIKSNPSETQLAISNKANALNINSSGTRLGYARIEGWSSNFYPKQGSYVYGHLIDRWGNVFNKVWKSFNVDTYASTLTGSLDSVGYNLFEDGGSNLDTVTLDSAQTQFLLDDSSTYEDGVFTTTGGSFSVDTGSADTQYGIVITDKAGNKTTSSVTTDSNGVLTINVEDACADLSSGAYTFDFNGTQVNLYSSGAKLIRSARITSTSIVGTQSVATVVTDSKAIKVQLVENGATRTFTKDSRGVTVTENADGTLTWTIAFKLGTLGEHTFGLRARTLGAWEDSDITLTTTIVISAPAAQEALKSVTSPTVKAGVKPQVKVRVAEGTDSVRFIYEDGGTITYPRNENNIISTVDSVETWVVTLPTRGIATEVNFDVIAKYNGAWQKNNVKVSTVTFYKEAAADAAIYSVEADASEVKVGTNVTFNILTNAETTKVQYVYPNGGTYTFTPDNAKVTDLGDGTEMWTVTVRLMSVGNIPVTFRARSTTAWIDTQSFGSVNVVR